ncbi:MAG: hypothetical protein KGI66_05105, partial [Patescibacteria group bacterium]|nr:hypothetical protein [Patescibacteria group bacterium]
FLYDKLTAAFGVGYFLIPVLAAILGMAILQGMEKHWSGIKTAGGGVFFLSGLGLLYLAPGHGWGGTVGYWVGGPLVRMVDVWAAGIFLGALLVISLILMFEWRISWQSVAEWKKEKMEGKKVMEAGTGTGISDKEQAAVDDALAAMKTKDIDGAKEPTARQMEAAAAAERLSQSAKPAKPAKPAAETESAGGLYGPDEIYGLDGLNGLSTGGGRPFTPPPLSLLEKDRGRAETGDIKANANIIKRTLQNFGITVEMDEISIGPSVTRYALKPAEGVKLSRIVALNNDLALALAAHPIRIEAPIPGKSLVGIEVPNTAKTTVGLATLIGSAEFAESKKPLMVTLGKNITGRAHFSDLAKAPHMLIAGATGSGKSVTIHALITSLLYRNSPEDMKFIMIDPKRVELTLYNKIPHLLTPVITDPKKAILALKWAAK